SGIEYGKEAYNISSMLYTLKAAKTDDKIRVKKNIYKAFLYLSFMSAPVQIWSRKGYIRVKENKN
ncbi:734_t:CDS:2, partial [Dentiscutata heterogama]